MIPGRVPEGTTLPVAGERRGTGLTVFHLYIALVAARFLASLLLSEPVILSDELTYKSMAWGFFSSGNFGLLRPETIGAVTNIPYVFYPLLLSFTMAFGENFLVVGKLLNALLINAAIFPFFWILRDFVPRRRAVWAAALPLILPSFGYSAFLMAENAFLPLAAAGLFLLYRQFSRRRPLDAVISSIVLVFLALTKPQAGAFLAAIPLAAGVLLVSRRERAADPRRMKDILSGLGVMLLAVLAGGVLFDLAVPGIGRRILAFARGAIHFFDLFPSRPAGASGDVSEELARAGAAHLAVILFLFLIPALELFRTWTKSLRSSDRKRDVLSTLVLSFVLVSVLATIFVTASFSRQEQFGRLHGRFYSAVFPFLLVAFAAFGGDGTWSRGRKITLGVFAAAALGLGAWALPPYLTGASKSMLAVDFPELGWAAFCGPVLLTGAILLFVLLAAAVLIKGKAKGYPGFFLAIVLMVNFVQYRTFVRTYQPDRVAFRTARSFVAGRIADPRAKVAVFSRGQLPRWLLVFWHPYVYTRSDEIPPDGVLSRTMIPAGTDFAVVFGECRTDFQSFQASHQAGCSVFPLSGRADVLKDFVGIYPDAPGWTWTGRTFAYSPNAPFQTLVLILNERRPYFPKFLDIETEQGAKRIRLDEDVRRIELPYSAYYRFRLDRVFSPRRLGLNREDSRALGISLKEAFIQD